ncbi:restriction endonuclease subunit S [Campylobacter sputorum]|uniref:restriction endonuclease subunit S n=1 Tax=Campylobacter sputorum TaxID=206 RepID=UPI001F192E90|nr:restriction endonuclease subunit S [Campylobacter sputorum]ASM36442.1 type IIG restriction/modification system, specificity subunit [Campylobacter sputorum bv. faecalis CCUG 20703]
MFESFNGDFDIQKKHINEKGEFVITAGLSDNGILGKTDVKAKIFGENTITIDMFGYAFYRPFKYKMVTHARVFSLYPKFKITKNHGLFIANSFHFFKYKFGYENMCSWNKIKHENIKLPINLKSEIDFEFMENFIAELEAERIAELEAYLRVTNLKDYKLTTDEQNALKEFENLDWKKFNLENLFGKSTRGKRLKSDDRIPGNLPFVTAGENSEGISDFIGNNIEIFSKNTTTIDMFGSAKYRNYDYGADDHIAVVHTENLNKYAAIFITTSIHKASYTGEFHYGRNFYAKDADCLNINLPTKNGEIDFKFMENFITAVQKLVIKDVVLYADEKIEVTKKIVCNKG